MADAEKKSYLSVWSVASMGIGAMVGAGIFALLGQATLLAGKAVYWSFILAGVAALLSGYSYSRLGIKYPGSGGIMDYYNQAFHKKVIAGSLSLVYLVSLIITVALISKSFGAYATSLFLPQTDDPVFWNAVFSTSAILILGWLNMMAANAVGKSELIMVLIKLSILGVLMVASFGSGGEVIPEVMPKSTWSGVFSAVGLTFFAYAGYGMMANTAGNLRNPTKSLPRAIFLAIGVVMVLYIILSYVVLTNVPLVELEVHSETAIAQAAYPVLGKWGFIGVSIAALIATASAINASLFSVLRISKGLAETSQLVPMFMKPVLKNGSRGFLWVLLFIMVITNAFNLGFIANIVSATFVLSYLGVFVAHYILRKETNTKPAWIITGFVVMLALWSAFMYQVGVSDIWTIVLIFAVVGLCFLVEWLVVKFVKLPNLIARGDVPNIDVPFENQIGDDNVFPEDIGVIPDEKRIK